MLTQLVESTALCGPVFTKFGGKTKTFGVKKYSSAAYHAIHAVIVHTTLTICMMIAVGPCMVYEISDQF